MIARRMGSIEAAWRATIEDDQKRSGGLITRGDLGRYTAKLRKPFRFHFQGVDVLTTAAPSSGPVLAEMAMMVEIAGAGRFRAPGVESMHWLAEIEKRAFYDRNRWLGDPAFSGVRQSPFRDRPRLQSLVASINPAPRDADGGPLVVARREADDDPLLGGRRLGDGRVDDHDAQRFLRQRPRRAGPGIRVEQRDG